MNGTYIGGDKSRNAHYVLNASIFLQHSEGFMKS